MKNTNKKQGIAIDVNTISGFTYGGKKMTIAEILSILKETGTLVYDSGKGEKPILFDTTLGITLIESNTPEAKDAIKKYYESTKD